MDRHAVISYDGKYRYLLTRTWDVEKPRVCFVMLNPSTADGHGDDPTIRKCIGFARAWAFGSLSVVNLYAYRATDPKDLSKVPYPVGEENDAYIEEAARESACVVAAWGAGIRGSYSRAAQVTPLLKNAMCLGITQKGMPRHPLYVSYARVPSRYLRDGEFVG